MATTTGKLNIRRGGTIYGSNTTQYFDLGNMKVYLGVYITPNWFFLGSFVQGETISNIHAVAAGVPIGGYVISIITNTNYLKANNPNDYVFCYAVAGSYGSSNMAIEQQQYHPRVNTTGVISSGWRELSSTISSTKAGWSSTPLVAPGATVAVPHAITNERIGFTPNQIRYYAIHFNNSNHNDTHMAITFRYAF